MKTKYILQVVHDTALTALLLSLMGYHLWGEAIHEWLGVAFLLGVLLHNGLDFYWFKKLFKGEYSAYRTLQTSVNVLVFVAFAAAMTSGLMLSQYVLPDLPIHSNADWVRETHMAGVHWLQLLLGIHLGMHWKMLAGFFHQICKLPAVSFVATRILPLLWAVIATYGLYAFFQRELLPYLFLQVTFAFFDSEESKWLFYWDFFAILIFFAYSTRFLVWLILFRQKDGR
ncbi:membrane protein [Chelonobacter oris]|uniref:Membrane protein n=1 Tax=Chelonobacter oris TaxID=505317 RepID=A0A0A3AW53_9PAST|nr:DUF4405 domain-containing protein [Chelonobacter oris]KGQ71320.1 membrane protein [Chelonobacter oris]